MEKNKQRKWKIQYYNISELKLIPVFWSWSIFSLQQHDSEIVKLFSVQALQLHRATVLH